jgi:hypothetical protein
MENGGRISWEKKSSLSINAEKTNNAPNYVERLEWLYSNNWPFSIKTQNYNKIKVSCSANQQNVTLHVKHDLQFP